MYCVLMSPEEQDGKKCNKISRYNRSSLLWSLASKSAVDKQVIDPGEPVAQGKSESGLLTNFSFA